MPAVFALHSVILHSCVFTCKGIFGVQAKQRAMEELTPGQASVLARNERAIEQTMVRTPLHASFPAKELAGHGTQLLPSCGGPCCA